MSGMQQLLMTAQDPIALFTGTMGIGRYDRGDGFYAYGYSSPLGANIGSWTETSDGVGITLWEILFYEDINSTILSTLTNFSSSRDILVFVGDSSSEMIFSPGNNQYVVNGDPLNLESRYLQSNLSVSVFLA